MKALKTNWTVLSVSLILGGGFAGYSFASDQSTALSNKQFAQVFRTFKGFPTASNCMIKIDATVADQVSKVDYTGGCKEGFADGQGAYTIYDKSNKVALTYKGSFKNGLENGQGLQVYFDGSKYEGEFEYGQFGSKGTYTFAGGDKYIGENQNNIFMNGNGLYIWSNGSKYEGEYQNGRRHGLGKFMFVKDDKALTNPGSAYRYGRWQGDVFVVQGIFYNNSIQRQNIMSDTEYSQALQQKRERDEKLRLEAEAKAKAEQERLLAEKRERDFIANFKACPTTGNQEYFGSCELVGTDQFVGISLTKQNGKYTQMMCHNGQKVSESDMIARLTKDFKGDRCWQAAHLLPNSCKLDNYIGQCDSNKQPHGIGYHYNSPRFYMGTFVDGKKSGTGTQIFTNDNDRYDGEWLNGYYHGQGTYTFADGRKYVGSWKDDKKHGQGTFAWANGDKYEGSWQSDKRNGQGTYTFADGRKYVGSWKDSDYHGFGTLSFPKDGSYTWYKERGYGSLQGGRYVVEGEWENDEFVAACKPNRQACDKGRAIHAKKQAEIAEKERLEAQKREEAEARRRAEEAKREPVSLVFTLHNCYSQQCPAISVRPLSGQYVSYADGSTGTGYTPKVQMFPMYSHSSLKGRYEISVTLSNDRKTIVCTTTYDYKGGNIGSGIVSGISSFTVSASMSIFDDCGDIRIRGDFE